MSMKCFKKYHDNTTKQRKSFLNELKGYFNFINFNFPSVSNSLKIEYITRFQLIYRETCGSMFRGIYPHKLNNHELKICSIESRVHPTQIYIYFEYTQKCLTE